MNPNACALKRSALMVATEMGNLDMLQAILDTKKPDIKDRFW